MNEEFTWHESTVIALATPVGTGALAVLRMTGSRALDIFSACTGGRSFEPRRATLCKVRDQQGHVIDEVIATYFAAPASFTGEDVIEITCHGGMLVVRRLQERLIAAGAQAAEAGEFSRRAFEQGKLDLTQAEAVMDVIAASSDLALRAAQNQLGGAISTRVGAAVQELISLTAHIEAYIDFPDEDISPDSQAALTARLRGIAKQLQALLATADEGRLLREGVRTVLVGAPNAGKSSLLNCLLGYERAIISEVAGTTRDTIEERVNLGPLCLRLIDTAGLHESADAIECAGMERSRQAGAAADLLIEVVDASRPPIALDLDLPETTKRLLVLNKCDLPLHEAWANDTDALRISCIKGEGIPDLEKSIEELFFTSGVEEDSLAAINMRHRSAIERALQHLNLAEESLEQAVSPEFVSLELRDALDALGSITGKVDTEDILGSIFSQFCLGK
ncbi:MAG: tRNA uridine-5-carboxymethylaminomethyl(34) synthesis GTPase MnmE [Akkermansia sp.]